MEINRAQRTILIIEMRYNKLGASSERLSGWLCELKTADVVELL